MMKNAYGGNENKHPLFRLVIPKVPYPNVFSHIAMAPLGALHIATAIDKNTEWEVEVIDELNWKRGVSRRELSRDPLADHRELQARRPADAVGFYGGLTSTIPRLFQVAQFYRGLGVRTITGGAHVDALPEEALREGIDVVVHGEGEETIVEILRAWDNQKSLLGIGGISCLDADGNYATTGRRMPICDLDNIPDPDFSLLKDLKRKLMIAPIERTRGCNYNCEFCIVNDRFGPCRSASPEKVAGCVEKLVDKGFHYFFCVDDNFTQGKEDTLRLLELIKDIKKRKHVSPHITVQVRSSVGRDEKMIRALREAGIQVLAIGLESPIREELEEMNKHQTPEQIEKDIRTLRRSGFMIHGMFIFGYPMENSESSLKLTLRERADMYISFIKRNAIDTIQILKPVPIPGSRLAERLRSQGRILPLNLAGWDKYDGNFLTFLPDAGISAAELQKQATRIMKRFYSPFSFLRFPVLVFDTPVRILRMGFKGAKEFTRDPAGSTRAAISGGAARITAFKAGFREAGQDISRRWRNAAMRTFGSHIVASWCRTAKQKKYIRILDRFQQSRVTINGNRS